MRISSFHDSKSFKQTDLKNHPRKFRYEAIFKRLKASIGSRGQHQELR